MGGWSHKSDFQIAIRIKTKKGRTQTGAPFFGCSFDSLIIILTFTEQLATCQTFRILG